MNKRNNYDDYEIRLTEKQRELASKLIDVTSYKRAADLNSLLEPLDDFVIDSMNEDGELSEEGKLYERLRDDIFYYNEYEDYEPRFI